MTEDPDGVEALVPAAPLSAWLLEQEPDLPGEGEVTVARLAEGHSNLTFVLSRAGTDAEWILRRPPRGPLLPTAHDVLREHKVVTLLRQNGDVRTARPIASTDDPAVIGVPLSVMSRERGTAIRDQLPGWLDNDVVDSAARRELSFDLVDALAELHAAPVAPFVEAGIGKPSGYLGRQVARWTRQREGIQSAFTAGGLTARELPDYDVLRDWLGAHVPDAGVTSVVHGDYKLDNVLVLPPCHVTSILDWEMATVGDPVADLGYLLSFWIEPGEPAASAAQHLGVVTARTGFPTRAELIDRYAVMTGRTYDPETIRWATALAVWKLAVLLEMSYSRHLFGMADDPFFATLETGVPDLLARAREIAGV